MLPTELQVRPAQNKEALSQQQQPSSNKDTETSAAVAAEGSKKKKKKKKKKPKSKRGRNKPTGFEEFSVDAPVTLAEFTEDKTIYDQARPIIHRIEDAILRFQQKRRFDSERHDVFLKYLAYGGVNIQPKMFGGLDQRDLQEMDAEQILLTKANASIDWQQCSLLVDFDLVVKGYLTSYFPFYFNPETEDMVKLATVTIRSFLSFLLHHDVCPEYHENINAARNSCDIAEKELWKNQQFTAEGPGDFNMACSFLFGGYFHDNNQSHGDDNDNDNENENEGDGESSNKHKKSKPWADSKDESTPSRHMIQDFAAAWKVVRFGLAMIAPETQIIRFQQLAESGELSASKVEDIDGFEVSAVVPADEETHAFYRTRARDLSVVGLVKARAFCDPENSATDLQPDSCVEEGQRQDDGLEFEFVVEESLLRHCYAGMKVITAVWQLNCGLYYFDEVFMVYCSAYTVLANDLMLGWKPPREVQSARSSSDEESDENGNVDIDQDARADANADTGCMHQQGV